MTIGIWKVTVYLALGLVVLPLLRALIKHVDRTTHNLDPGYDAKPLQIDTVGHDILLVLTWPLWVVGFGIAAIIQLAALGMRAYRIHQYGISGGRILMLPPDEEDEE